ncbi:MAG: hypothetical protein KC547_06425 [Anaerolineae bacterium]|nr:hypothetical protein [Anaerolineae bacterium]MCA9909077.1 hypothetical protein [Anaerolineae bacterium]
MTPEDAIQRLYETPNLFDQLRDDEASALLKWAETEVMRIAQNSPDDAAFEAQFYALSDLAQQINLFVGMRQEMSFGEQQEALTKITEQAAQIGLHPVPLSASAQAQADESDAAVLHSLLDMLKPESPASDSAENDAETQPKRDILSNDFFDI